MEREGRLFFFYFSTFFEVLDIAQVGNVIRKDVSLEKT